MFKRFGRFLSRLVGRPVEPRTIPLAPPRYFHPMDVITLTCRRCGLSSAMATRTPCKTIERSVRKPNPALEALEMHDRTRESQTIVNAGIWADAFGPLAATFRVPDEENTRESASAWDTSPASGPSSSSTPGSASPSSGSNSGGNESGPKS